MHAARVTFDFETRSKADLKKVGAYKYSLDPSTRPTCLSFKERGHDRVYLLKFDEINRPWIEQPKSFRHWWKKRIRRRYLFVAQNAFFERCIYQNILVKRYGWPPIPFKQYRCTAAKAAACALPRSLEGAGEALELRIQKDKRGYNAMMATCKPTKRWNAYWKCKKDIAAGVCVTERRRKNARVDQPEPPAFLEYNDAPDVWNTLYHYCKIDVVSEEELDLALPDLIPLEQEIWHLNQTINWRGLRCDLPTVKKVIGVIGEHGKVKKRELELLTAGLITKPRSIKKIMNFLALEGVELPNLQKKTVEDALNGFGLSDDMRALLEITSALSLASIKKYQALHDRSDDEGYIRDIVLYHGASTGRDGGTGINPYNFPRGLMPVDKRRPYAMVDNVADCDPEVLKILYGEKLMLVFSAILRSMIIPAEGHEFFVADFSKIEVAVLWWLSGHEEGLKLLKSGKDPYIFQAAANLGKTYDEVKKACDANEQWALDARQLGKAQILGCGFRMSWKKFMLTAWSTYRLKLTRKQSYKAVKDYRENNDPVPVMWNEVEAAAVAAVETGRLQTAAKCKFFTKDRFLWIELPSGRRLAYRDPSIVMKSITYTALEEDQDGNEIEVERQSEPKKTVQFMGLDKSKKKLQTEFTHGAILTENIVQAVARDLMMPALLRLEKAKYRVRLSVYDEGVCDRKKGLGSVSEFVRLLCQVPAWGKGLPIEAQGWCGPRYRK